MFTISINTFVNELTYIYDTHNIPDLDTRGDHFGKLKHMDDIATFSRNGFNSYGGLFKMEKHQQFCDSLKEDDLT